MKLTNYQKRYLAAILYMRGHTPNLWSMLMFRPKSWLPFLFIIAASFAVYFFFNASLGLFLIGLMTGSVLRIIGHARFALMAWPVNQEIIDWSKVEALQKEAQT